LLDDFIEQREIRAAVLSTDGGQPLCGDPKRVGDGQADGPGTDIKRKDAFFSGHTQDYRGWYTHRRRTRNPSLREQVFGLGYAYGGAQSGRGLRRREGTATGGTDHAGGSGRRKATTAEV